MRKPKTDKLLKGIVGTGLAVATLTGCGNELTAIPEYADTEYHEAQLPSPGETDCDSWMWDDEDGAYQCIEENSGSYGHYYYGGKWYKTKSAFKTAKANLGTTVTNRNSTQTNQVTQPKTNTNNNSTITNSRSGMGSGGSYGG